jgi:hypothetical protein
MLAYLPIENTKIFNYKPRLDSWTKGLDDVSPDASESRMFQDLTFNSSYELDKILAHYTDVAFRHCIFLGCTPKIRYRGNYKTEFTMCEWQIPVVYNV